MCDHSILHNLVDTKFIEKILLCCYHTIICILKLHHFTNSPKKGPKPVCSHLSKRYRNSLVVLERKEIQTSTKFLCIMGIRSYIQKYEFISRCTSILTFTVIKRGTLCYSRKTHKTAVKFRKIWEKCAFIPSKAQSNFFR